MADISFAADSVSRAGVISPADPAPRRARITPEPAGLAPHADSVELSDAARFLARLKEQPAVRQDVIDQAKASIDAGHYDSPDVLDTVADRLARDLNLRG